MKKLIGLFVAFFLGATLHADSFYATPEITVGRMPDLPADGMYSAQKLKFMTGMCGFSAQNGVFVTPRAEFYVGTDGRNLRFFSRCETGPEGLLTRAKKGNAGTFAFLDDCFEFAIFPEPASADGDGYHLIVNSAGGYLAEMKHKNIPKAWDPEFRFGSRFDPEKHLWDFEVSIPLAQLGINAWKPGRAIGFRVVRNWRRLTNSKFGMQTSWGNGPCEYFSRNNIPLVRLNPDAPVVQLLRFCNEERTRAGIDISLQNPTSGRMGLKTHYMFKPDNSKSVDETTAIELAPWEIRTVRFQVPQMAMNELARTYLKISSEDGKKVYYLRSWNWKLGNPPFFEVQKNSVAEKVTFKYAFYASDSAVFTQFNCEELSPAEFGAITGIAMTVTDKTGHVIAAKKLSKPAGRIVESLWQLPDLKAYTTEKNPSGDYTLRAEITGLQGLSYTKHFQRKVFHWENGNLGNSDILIPPYTVIEVKGNTVSTILRKHELNGTGLWKQVTADSRNLLTGNGMQIIAVIGNKEYPAAGTLQIARKKPTRVDFTSKWNAGELKADVKGYFDYDGLMRYMVTLRPCKSPVQSLKLLVPLDPEEVYLMHACTDLIRSNYAGLIPKGEGTVWKSSEAVRRNIRTSFVPYVWVGMETSGLCIFAENDRNWGISDKVPAQEIIRRNGKLCLVYNLIAKPEVIREARTIDLGFQATPVKPMPENWRRMVHWNYPWDDTAQKLRKHLVYIMYFRGNSPSRGTGGKYGSSGVAPRDDDMALWNKMEEIIRKRKATGKNQPMPEEFVRKWVRGYRGPKEDLEYYNRATREGISSISRDADEITWYTNIRGIVLDTPEARTFLDDWCIGEFQNTRDKVNVYEYDDYGLDPVKSYQDYALYWQKLMFEKFTPNIYWDCAFLISSFNRSGKSGVYSLPDGRVQPVMGLYNMREFIRRTAVMELEMGRKPNNAVHITNANLIPVIAFSQHSADWEDNKGVKPYQERYTREYLRVVSTGRQTGNVGSGQCLVTLGRPETEKTFRSAAGVCLTHEIPYSSHNAKLYWKTKLFLHEFGYGYPLVKVHNYWDKDYPVHVSGNPASLYMTKGKEAILVVCDYDHLKHYKAKFPGRIRSAERLVEPGPCKFSGTELAFDLEKYDFAVYHLHFE